MMSLQQRWEDLWRDPKQGTLLLRRAGFLGTALVCWHAATVIHESGSTLNYGLSALLMLSGYLLGFLNLGLAIFDRPSRRAQIVIPLSLTLAFVIWGQMASIAGREQGVLSTDVWIFMDYAAQLLLDGENPYTQELLEAFRINRMGFHFSTPLLDGSLSGRVAYPALSFLVFVPLRLLSIPTEWLFPLTLGVSWLLIYRWAPAHLRPLVLLPFFFEDRYLFYAFGGVSDSGWALLLLMMVRSWDKPTQRAVFYGLAASFKHQPWLLAPLLLVRLWHEAGAEQRWREMWRFAWISTVTFLVLNSPFILWSPTAWLAGVFEPVVAPMITFGQGLSMLSMFGVAAIPKGLHSLLMLMIYALGLWTYARHYSRVRALLWIVPALALFFANRSLTSYWYYYLIPLVLDLVWRWSSPRSTSQEVRVASVSWRPTALAAVGVAVLVVVVTLWGVVRARPLEVRVLAPIISKGNFASALSMAHSSGAAFPQAWRASTVSHREQHTLQHLRYASWGAAHSARYPRAGALCHDPSVARITIRLPRCDPQRRVSLLGRAGPANLLGLRQEGRGVSNQAADLGAAWSTGAGAAPFAPRSKSARGADPRHLCGAPFSSAGADHPPTPAGQSLARFGADVWATCG
ncbi:MAG: hypothetical protein JRH20_27835, partial [Deltaproteobacteria bacterium]|nr:hypothetical protein [Deltaproteobacteria bacterium]